MYLTRPQSLGKTVAVTATNRPIKIAYLVPYNESALTHLILDAIFYESYTRWGGVYTLIIPVNSGNYSEPNYEPWLEFFDPDFIYTYVTLEDDFVKRIDRLCAPMAFLTHTLHGGADQNYWRTFLPAWDNYFSAVSSMTTVSSPHTQHSFFAHHAPENELSVITQYDARPDDRFVRDNFGAAFHINIATNPIPGLFKTLCVVQPGLSPQMVVGTERCTSIAELFSAINTRRSIPIAKLAMTHSEEVPKTPSWEWSNNFNLFIGGSVLNRINFWNARHFTPSHSGTMGALIVEPAFFDDGDLVKLLGQYLNANNYSQGNGPPKVAIRSRSLSRDDLSTVKEKLQAHTHSTVSVGDFYNLTASPKPEDLHNNFFNSTHDSTIFRITEDQNTILAKKPDHFAFIPPRHKGIAMGNWVVMHDIERHNNLSQYSNVVDRWLLPKRQKLARAFTNALGKVSRCRRLSLIPKAPGPLFGQVGSVKYTYDLHLPNDGTFFRYLLTNFSRYVEPDRRAGTDNIGFEDISISDKGENLRGIISMFENLSDAYKILTNKFWRDVMRSAKDESVRYLTYDSNKLLSHLPNDRPSCEKLKVDLNFDNIGEVKKFMKANLVDTLEFLIKTRIFFQVHIWRCEYCGHSNCRSFDDMRIKNSCDICSSDYFVPVDMKWVYQLNEFVHRTLVNQDGLPVLWALGFIQDYIANGNFWFIPEVDLYESIKPVSKKEIDIVCVADGKLYAIEVKLTASQLQKPDEISKFIDKINKIQPDVAMLVFERYSENEEDAPAIQAFLEASMDQIRQAIGSHIELKKMVANDVTDFNEHPRCLGHFGSRTNEFH